MTVGLTIRDGVRPEIVDRDGTIIGDFDTLADAEKALAEGAVFGWSPYCEEDPDFEGLCHVHKGYCTLWGPQW